MDASESAGSHRFEIQVMSGPECEDLFAEVLCEGQLCFVVTQELGFDQARIAIHARSDGLPWNFSMQECSQILQNVMERLWELRRSEA